MKKPVIEVSALSRSFGEEEVLHSVSLSIPSGEIYGLLGPNGAGKTTLIKILAGLLAPTAGTAEICGLDVAEHRTQVLSRVGTLIETPVFYDHLSARDNLEIHLAYMEREGDITAALTRVGLEHTGAKPVSRFSLGMRQRLALARTIVHQPEVLLLDEPLNGLDPIAIGEMRRLVQSLAAEGMSILLSSHILREVEHTASRIGVLSHGRLVLEEQVEALKASHPDDLEDFLVTQMSGGAK